MKRPQILLIGLAAIILAICVGQASAQRNTAPAGCLNVASLKARSANANPRTDAQIASDKLVADGKAALSGNDVARSISLLEQAVKTDPKNAGAYIFLARAHTQSQRYLSVPKKTARARASENLTKGRELDPANIDGLQLLADQVLAENGEHECARKLLEAALNLDPQNARTNYYLSQLLSGMGEFDLAFQYADRALALADANTKNFVLINAGRPRYMAGQYDWVLDHYAKYLESNPNNWLAHFYRSLAFGAKGMFQPALAEAKIAMPNAPKGDAGGIGMLALAYANAGQKDKARELLNELLQRDARGEHVVEYRIAAVYEVLGQREEAFRWMDKQIDDREGLGSWLVWINYDPVWNAARKDPRWKDIQQRSGWPSVISQDAVPIEKEPMHRLKFENEFVRLFDVLVPAGETTKFHVHLYDGISVRVSTAKIVDESQTGEQKPFDIKYGDVTFGSRSKPETHRVINTGNTDFRNIFIEILPSKTTETAKAFPILSDGHTILIDNERVRVNRLVLKPGESSKLHRHNMHGLGIILYDSKIEMTFADGTKRALEPKAGDYAWQNAGTTHIIKNVGSTVFEAIDIELKQ